MGKGGLVGTALSSAGGSHGPACSRPGAGSPALGALAEESVWGRKGLLAGRGTAGHQVPSGKSHSHFLTRGPSGFGRVPRLSHLDEESGILDAGLSAAGAAPGLPPSPGVWACLTRTHGTRSPAKARVWASGAWWGRILGQRSSFLSWAPSCRLGFFVVL